MVFPPPRSSWLARVGGLCSLVVMGACATPAARPAVDEDRPPPDEEEPARPIVSDEEALSRINAARAERDAGHPDRAAADLEDLVASRPDDGLARLELAVTLQHLGAETAAIRPHLDRALAQLPGNPRAQYVAALFAESEGNYDAAIAGYGQVLTLRAEHTEARLRLANVLLRQGAYAEARAHYRIVVEQTPTSAAALLGLSEASEQSGDLASAERALDQLVTTYPRVVAHHQRKIRFLRRIGANAKADAAQAALDALDPQAERKLRDLKRSRPKKAKTAKKAKK